jgi:hypothetical protein
MIPPYLLRNAETCSISKSIQKEMPCASKDLSTLEAEYWQFQASLKTQSFRISDLVAFQVLEHFLFNEKLEANRGINEIAAVQLRQRKGLNS